MKRIIITALVLLPAFAFAQNGNNSADNKSAKAPQVFTFVERMPEFPGGMNQLNSYLSRNIHYPDSAIKADIHGKVVVKFVVGETGEIKDAIVLRGIGGGCDEEALRVVRNMPSWKPGIVQGKPVSVYFTLPITFSLQEDNTNKKTK